MRGEIMIQLREMTSDEYRAWIDYSTKQQAKDRASVSGRTYEEEYQELTQILPMLLPNGFDSEGHFFSSIDYGEKHNIGFTWFGTIPGLPKGIIYLMDIYVDPAFRGKGIASTTLNKQHKMLREHGFESVMLSVLKSNPAMRIYQKLGYEILEETAHHAEMIKSIK